MARFHRALALPLALALFASCAQLARTPLSDAHRQAITTSKTIGNVSQQEIGTTINPSQGGAAIGGLLGALVDTMVDSGRAEEAEGGAADLRDELKAYDPRTSVKAVLAAELKNVAPFQGTQLELKAEPRLDKVTLTALVDSAGTDALLVVDFDYRLSPNFRFINVTAVATLLPTKAAASPVLQALASTPSTDQALPSPIMYRGVFMTSYPSPEQNGTIDPWLADRGAAAKVAIEGGIAEVVRMLVWDLQQGGPEGATYSASGSMTKAFPQFGVLQWFAVPGRNGDRTWYRATTGQLASVGDVYPGLSVAEFAAAAAAAAAAADAAKPRPQVVPPTTDAKGGLTFEFASTEYMRQGGAIEKVQYSEVASDVAFEGYSLENGVFSLKGKVGLGKGSTFGGLGAHLQLQLDGKPMDAMKLNSVTVRVSASTRVIRLRLVGNERATRKNGCFPVYDLEVDDQMKEYTVPFIKFAPDAACGPKARELRQTLPKLTAIEVVSTRVTKLPLTVSIGAVTLNP